MTSNLQVRILILSRKGGYLYELARESPATIILGNFVNKRY